MPFLQSTSSSTSDLKDGMNAKKSRGRMEDKPVVASFAYEYDSISSAINH